MADIKANWTYNWIEFKLDGYVEFSNWSLDPDFVYCEFKSPFDTYRIGFQIEINNDQTKYIRNNHSIEKTAILRRFSSNELVSRNSNLLSVSQN